MAAAGLLLVSQLSYGGSFGDVLKAVAEGVIAAQTNQAGSANAPGQSGSAGNGAAVVTSAGTMALKDGVVTDSATGLTWMACPFKDDLSGINCATGDSGYYKADWWDAALAVKKLNYAGFKDWRLPTVAELSAIHKCTSETSYYYSEQNPNPDPEFIDVPTAQGTLKVRNVCKKTQLNPLLDNAVFVFDQRGFNDSLWTSTPSQDLKQEELWGYPAKETYWTTRDGKFLVAPPQDKSLAKKKVLAVRGGSYDEFNAMLAKATAVQDKLTAAQRTSAAEKQKYEASRTATEQEKQKKLAAFRKALKAGDSIRTNAGAGLVLEVRGELVRAQIALAGCAERYADRSCAKFHDEKVERWLKREEIFPRDWSLSI